MSKECNGCGCIGNPVMISGATRELYHATDPDQKFKKTPYFSMKVKRLCVECFCKRILGFYPTKDQIKAMRNE